MADITSLLGSIQNIPTPFYFYDLELLGKSLDEVKKHGLTKGYKVHYAMKANANPRILEVIRQYHLGADAVSANEVKAALAAGFPKEEIVFAGVGKSDEEIIVGLSNDIFCFNCESAQEVEVINELAGKMGKKAKIALRINPNVDAKTHHYITTGMKENKFGLPPKEIDQVIDKLPQLANIQLTGIHFHIGSQVTSLESYTQLAQRANDFNVYFRSKGIELQHVNVGGGLGIDYVEPKTNPVPDFKSYFEVFEKQMKLAPGQELHFELGRAIVGQCGSLISKVLYNKEGETIKFLIIDAGMTELIRPALYQAEHFIENITSQSQAFETYDVVGPICESSDAFRRGIELKQSKRGDLLAIRSAGAYGEVMMSRYNLRDNAKTYFDVDLG
ncbi:diaminopimelate decarboxylase [Imperialibacter roseus]|uniref:Diaminopimelate decarboxylase n=1 Tax=Imperialibacter roseus TaxID=1324217 RepID=A0ABZ0IZ07_9BACT|nr:diaminopimelate decarboxylase [Imperialibacter roseus]WOK08916.1 diaminopimelate decarboxylase [Imperialibacter roseus]